MLISEKCLLHVKVLMLRACIGPVFRGRYKYAPE